MAETLGAFFLVVREKYGNPSRLSPMLTHRFNLDDIETAYELFVHQREGVLKVAITP